MVRQGGRASAARELARRLASSKKDGKARGRRLRHVSPDELTIRRRKNGHGFTYVRQDGRTIREPQTLRRLKRLAVPPAYEDVRFAEDAFAHLQAIGRDSAGRFQYRYHPDWDKVREKQKARHLSKLVQTMPLIRAAISRHLRDRTPSREFALAAAIELIALTALRPGSETYAREHGTRGAATLLQSDVSITGDHIKLRFRGKGGRMIERELREKRLANALKRLKSLPGPRLFQYRALDGGLRIVRRRDVNAFLQEIASERVSLKDFRTMIACSLALQNLAALDPAPGKAGRQRQLRNALHAVSEELANTPTICRKSYVHALVIEAHEKGKLKRLASRVGNRSSRARGMEMLRLILEAAGRDVALR